MSQLRPSLIHSSSKTLCPRDGPAYLCILESVRRQKGLLHGRLKDKRGAFCAVGSYFADHKSSALPTEIIDEVALVNDSVKNKTPKQRKQHVVRWLRWKLSMLGMK